MGCAVYAVRRMTFAALALAITSVAPVHAQPASTLPFEIQSGRGPTGLVFEATAAARGPTSWARTIRIVLSGEARQSTAQLRIEDCVLETEAGAAAAIAPVAQPPVQELLPGASIPIELRGSFPGAGLYRGELVLVQDGRARIVPLKVALDEPAPPPPLPIQSHGGGAVSVTGGGAAAWALDVRNTGPVRLELAPVVAGVARLDRPDAPEARVRVDASGSEADRTAIDAGAVRPVPIRVPALDEPGIYEVEVVLRDAAGAHAPHAMKTIVYRRHPWWCAALIIALGAAVAFCVRWFIEGGEARLRLRGQLDSLRGRIRIARGTMRGDAVISALRVLELDVDERRRNLWTGGRTDALQAEVSRVELRLLLLAEVDDAAARIAPLEPARQAALRAVLDDALSAVRVDPGEAAIKGKREAISQLGVEAAWREQLAAWRAELAQQLEVQLPGASARLAEQLRKAGAELAKIGAQLATDQLADAHAALDALQRALLAALVEELSQLVRENQPPPLGVAPAAWASGAAEIRAQLAIAAAGDAAWPVRRVAFAAAQDRYIVLAVTGLAEEAERRAEECAGPEARLRALAAELRAAVAESPAAAAARYASARRELEDLGAPRVARGAVGTGAGGMVGDAVAELGAWLPRLFGARQGAAAPTGGSLPGAPAWDRVAQTSRWLVNAIVLAIGVASGVRALWVGDLAWGSGGAMLTAFLWGAGVQTAGNAFAGVLALRDRVGAAP